MLNFLLERFDQNISRVENLKSIYGPARRGRRKVHDTDILRAALVLLHATLEDFLRSLQIWKIPTWDAATIGKFPLSGSRATKFSLTELEPFKAMTVAELIQLSVSEELYEYASFNDVGQVKQALKSGGCTPGVVDALDYSDLATMIARRHNIVHKADRNENFGGQGNHRFKSIEVSQVEKYLAAVKSIRDMVEVELG